MLEFRKWKADIEACPSDNNGVTVEILAADRDEAERKLDWILQGVSRGRVQGEDARNWFNLEEVLDD